MSAKPGCAFACYGQERCTVGWPNGSCGAKEKGTGKPPHIPAHLPLAMVIAFERDPDSWRVYRDWCLDNDWPEKVAELESRHTDQR